MGKTKICPPSNSIKQTKKETFKRHDDVSAMDFKEQGYLPEALVNYLALVGWSPDDNEEIMSMDKLIEKFSFDRVSKNGGILTGTSLIGLISTI